MCSYRYVHARSAMEQSGPMQQNRVEENSLGNPGLLVQVSQQHQCTSPSSPSQTHILLQTNAQVSMLSNCFLLAVPAFVHKGKRCRNCRQETANEASSH